jgi:hypothetical protein
MARALNRTMRKMKGGQESKQLMTFNNVHNIKSLGEFFSYCTGLTCRRVRKMDEDRIVQDFKNYLEEKDRTHENYKITTSEYKHKLNEYASAIKCPTWEKDGEIVPKPLSWCKWYLHLQLIGLAAPYEKYSNRNKINSASFINEPTDYTPPTSYGYLSGGKRNKTMKRK